ncbi:hypothetical protein LY08_00613 [Olleya aquimaris]|uniref:Uncharacterized protein n=1 Tax=Olleya aquimaris TaxID=639310 RepID=A0A327RSY7_9FLAO|nr:hypothetical protein LY08_00613 [Olleya aquimaris]
MLSITGWLFPETNHCAHHSYWYKAYKLYAQYSGAAPAIQQNSVLVVYSMVIWLIQL